MTTPPRHDRPETPEDAPADAAGTAGTDLPSPAKTLDARLVRESGRDTWFVVNGGKGPVTEIPVELAGGGGVRRVLVNGEPVKFEETEAFAVAHAPQPLRPGQGTIVVVHYR